jgi:hypothetical protein
VRDLITGLPLCGATVRTDVDFGNGMVRTTDCAGFANFGVQASHLSIAITLDAYEAFTATIDVSQTTTRYISLVPLTGESGGLGPSGDENSSSLDDEMWSEDLGKTGSVLVRMKPALGSGWQIQGRLGYASLPPPAGPRRGHKRKQRSGFNPARQQPNEPLFRAARQPAVWSTAGT